jgi:hypothetical protein
MKRYFKEGKMLDSGKITIKDFIKLIFPEDEKISDVSVLVAYKIYIEDGGKKYKLEDFVSTIEERRLPVSEEDYHQLI